MAGAGGSPAGMLAKFEKLSISELPFLRVSRRNPASKTTMIPSAPMIAVGTVPIVLLTDSIQLSGGRSVTVS